MKIHLPLLEKLESHKILSIFLFLKMLCINLSTVHLAGNTGLLKLLSQLVQTLGYVIQKAVY